jgi:hypothetical protein
MFCRFLIFLLLSTTMAKASLSGAKSAYESRMKRTEKYRKIVVELAGAGKYFSAIPWMKEYLIRGQKTLDKRVEAAFESIISHTGVKQFELLPLKYLMRSKSNSVRYVIAKKLYKKESYGKALQYATNINPNHPIYPYASHLIANIHSARGNQSKAVSFFRDCERTSESRLKKVTGVRAKQLELNRDYCTAGIARALFASRKYDDADLKYLDIKKSSRIWPEILFEEAWNSYYQKNYNRTLGKLVTYKAPVFDYIFNPEIEVLTALAYLKLCLYGDAKKTSDRFWDRYLKPARKIRNYLKSKGRNTKYFYRLMVDFETSKRSNTRLLTNMLKSVSRDGAYLEIRNSLIDAAKELEDIKGMRSSRFKSALLRNISDVISTQKALLGSYVRNSLVTKYADLYRAFEGMSYIKLETLARRKQQLYSFSDNKGKKRGDIKYIERNEKQYFWDFNGEFWADELGDYVFALRSECN